MKTISSKALENKELWLIEIPSGIDISKLKALPVPDISSSSKKRGTNGASSSSSSTSPTKNKKLKINDESQENNITATIAGAQYTISSSTQHKLLAKDADGTPLLRLLIPASSSTKSTDNNKKSLKKNGSSDDNDETQYLSLSNHTFDRVISVTPAVTIPEINYSKEIKPQPIIPQLTGMKLKHFATGYTGSFDPSTENENHSIIDKHNKKEEDDDEEMKDLTTDEEEKEDEGKGKGKGNNIKASKQSSRSKEHNEVASTKSNNDDDDGKEPPEKKRKKEKKEKKEKKSKK